MQKYLLQLMGQRLVVQMAKVPVLEQYEWQKAVLDKDLNTPPDTPVKGGRYIVASSPTGDWKYKTKYIAEFNGLTWEFTKPKEGMLVLVSDEGVLYHYINSKWIDFALLINSKRRVSTHDSSYAINLDESGKVFVASSVNDVVFTLPSVESSDIGTTFTFAKCLKAGRITIKAADSDKIADSGAGCTIYNDHDTEEYTTLTIILLQETRWGILTGHGTWITTEMM